MPIEFIVSGKDFFTSKYPFSWNCFFKFFFALFDTPLFYIGVAMLKHRIKLSDDPVAEAAA